MPRQNVPPTLVVEDVPVADLRPHPRNYRDHPEDQVEHLAASLDQHGWYRNVVIARDGTILAGHGITLAATLRGRDVVPCVRLDVDPESPQALKVLAADNELTRFAVVDDRALTELLKDIAESAEDGLVGTGYDEMILANLLMVTRPANEIRDVDHAAEWIGLPDYEPAERPYKLIINCTSPDDRAAFIQEFGLAEHVSFTGPPDGGVMTTWYPPRGDDELVTDSSVKWVPADAEAS